MHQQSSTYINLLYNHYSTHRTPMPFLANGVHRRPKQRPRKIWKTLSNGVGGSRGMPRPWSALNVRRGCPDSSSPRVRCNQIRIRIRWMDLSERSFFMEPVLKRGGSNVCKCMVNLGIFPVRKCSVWVGNMTPLYHELQYHSIDGGITSSGCQCLI